MIMRKIILLVVLVLASAMQVLSLEPGEDDYSAE